MIPHVLDSTFERVRRAEEHIEDLRQRLADILRLQEKAVRAELNPRPPHYPKPILTGPTYAGHIIGILIGEVCYNLRTALDYLVFELIKLDTGCVKDFTQSPIVDSKDKFRGWKKGNGRGFNATHIACIEILQPYKGCNWTKRLRELSNPDKHRELIPIGGSIRIHAYARATTAHFDDVRETSITTAKHPVTGANVDVKIHFAGNIQLADGTPIIETLEEIKSQIANTLAAFKPDF
jgi:hypothetical protein